METGFDFQEWAQLAKQSPEAFEQKRRETIEAFIADSGAEQRRLGRNLQREIDYEIRRADSPQQALSAISKMMWAQVAFLGEELEALGDSMREFERCATLGADRLALALQESSSASRRGLP